MKRTVWLLIALALVGLTAGITFRAGARTERTDPAAPARLATTQPSVRHSHPSGDPHSSPTPSSSSTVDGAPVAVSRFVEAWLDKSGTRRERLSATCTPRLARLLARTDVEKIPDAVPDGPPVLVRQTIALVTYAQRLSDGTTISIDLVPDPTRRMGWVVTGVRPGGA